MTTTQFPIEPGDPMGIGPLFIVDPRVLIRPRVADQTWDVAHDTGHVCQVLLLGNDMMGSFHATHIVSDDSITNTRLLLDPVLRAHVDNCNFDRPCRAIVEYIAGDDTIITDEYGVKEAPDYTIHFYVYCHVPKGDATEAMLTAAIGRMVAGDRFVVARPDASAPDGYTAQGFTVNGDNTDPASANEDAGVV